MSLDTFLLISTDVPTDVFDLHKSPIQGNMNYMYVVAPRHAKTAGKLGTEGRVA